MNSILKLIILLESLVAVHAVDPVTVGVVIAATVAANFISSLFHKTPPPSPTSTCQKENGDFTEWSLWNECSVSCGIGNKIFTRSCTNPPPSCGGQNCNGVVTKTESCYLKSCPVNGGFSEWSSWGECSVTCGDGTKSKYRACTSPVPANNGESCKGETLVTKSCNLRKCQDCKKNECCDDLWVNRRVDELENELSSKVFGQHLVKNLVVNAVKNHINNTSPSSPLVMSFHGPTGSGKNYVSEIIANSIYKKGKKSNFVHHIVASKRFPHKSESYQIEYKKAISESLENNSKLCERTLFIFDEFHEMPENVGNSIAPYLDYIDEIDGIDYRKNIYIFLSNSVSEEIKNYTINHYRSNKARETIGSKDLEKIISDNAFYLPGGFKNSNIIKRALINVYVPFLPLERKHVKQCAEVEMKKRKKEVNDSTLETIANKIHYFPDEEQWFSNVGCKTLNHKITEVFAFDDEN
ncbi:torsin-1A-like [Hydra vulgaris]|uniref:Torsin-1A-like n=1 Tax=Hydra vulgaris TaxID=6087 RepID=A0ABM4DFC0_HYDVU